LPYLIAFGFTPVALDIDAGVALPGSPIHAVAGSRLASIAEVVVADSAEIFEAHAARAPLHLHYDLIDGRHYVIVSILILVSSDSFRDLSTVLLTI